MHHAFAIEAGPSEGMDTGLRWLKARLGMEGKGNPDVAVFEYGLFSVADARRVAAVAAQAPLQGETKAVIIAASRAYHEAQNALLKLFEEPPRGTYLFFIVPSLGMLLPTLRSRVHVLGGEAAGTKAGIGESAEEFIRATREKRGAIAKKLSSGRDEDERRAHRDEALAIVNGIERAAYEALERGEAKAAPLLVELAEFRSHLHDRSAPVRMILEHLAIVTPRTLGKERI